MHARLPLGTILMLLLMSPAHADPDWTAVGKAPGMSGAQAPGGVYRVGLPLRPESHP